MPPELSATPVEFEARPRVSGRRLDAYLTARFPDFSRSVIQKVIDAGAVLVNGQPGRASYRVRGGEMISVRLPDFGDGTPTAEDLPIRIIHEEDGFVVIDKAPGMIVHPARGNWGGTLVNALQFHFDKLSTVSGEQRPGVIHRLDRDTSGLILVGKDDKAHAHIGKQFEERTVDKFYMAIVQGVPRRDADYIEQPIGFHPTIREKMAVRRLDDGARTAKTFYEVVERFDGYALVRCKIFTGRTHQIRVHLTHIGHPVVADKMYLGRGELLLGDLTRRDEDAGKLLIDRQALHAHTIRFEHPTTGASLAFEAPLPADMLGVLEALRRHRPIVKR